MRNLYGWVAIILAVGIAVALNVMTFAALWVALQPFSSDVPRLGENSTQVLTGWGGGIMGVLGAYVGYMAKAVENDRKGDKL